MSFWVEGTDQKGRRVVWAIDVAMLPIVFVLGFIATLYAPRMLAGPLLVAKDGSAVVLVGFACFAVAKLSVIRRGIWTSFGSQAMTKWWKRLYRVGYALMALGVVLVMAAYATA